MLVPIYINYDKSVLIDYGNRSPKYNRHGGFIITRYNPNTIW